MSFDTESLIREVKCRRALWDVYSNEYSDREIKRKNWEEITDTFCGDNFSEKEKIDMCKSVQFKWRNIRTSFRREVKRRTGVISGSTASRKSSYIYFDQLDFLHESLFDNPTQGRANETAGDSEGDTNYILGNRSFSPISERKLLAECTEGTYLVDALRQNLMDYKDEDNFDPDRMFLLSLLKDLKEIPADRKQCAKLAIINAIKTAQGASVETVDGTLSAYPMDRGHCSHEYNSANPDRRKITSDTSKFNAFSSDGSILDSDTSHDSENDHHSTRRKKEPRASSSGINTSTLLEDKSGTLKRKSTQDKILGIISKKLKNTQSLDEYTTFGTNVAYQLKSIPKSMQPYCKKMINESLYEAEIGNLNNTSKIITSKT